MLVWNDSDRFCELCGAPITERDPATEPIAVTRHRLGGRTETVLVSPSPTTGHTDEAIIALPGADAIIPLPTGASVRTRKRKKVRKPLHRRPIPMAFLAVVIALIGVGGYGLVQLESTVHTIHAVSTLPAAVSDTTYTDPGGATPAEQVAGPIDTDPARTAVAQSAVGARFAHASSGPVDRVRGAASTTGAILSGALQASGLTAAQDAPLTILLMGVDARPGSAIDLGVRPDSLIVLRLDPAANSCRILSIPRDTRVELPGYGESKINHALMVGGIPYQLLVTQQYLGIDIDHYFLIDFSAFETVVDAVGGISVTVPEDLTKNGQVVYPKGVQTFDGEEALAFARFRSTSSDGDATRVERHWAILQALAAATKGTPLTTEISTILPQIETHVRTDLSVSQLLELADSYGGMCRDLDAGEIQKLDGTRVKLSDPILGHADYFNVVSEPTRRERVAELMGTAQAPDQPAATPPASPAPSPASTATPVPVGPAPPTPEAQAPTTAPTPRPTHGTAAS